MAGSSSFGVDGPVYGLGSVKDKKHLFQNNPVSVWVNKYTTGSDENIMLSEYIVSCYISCYELTNGVSDRPTTLVFINDRLRNVFLKRLLTDQITKCISNKLWLLLIVINDIDFLPVVERTRDHPNTPHPFLLGPH